MSNPKSTLLITILLLGFSILNAKSATQVPTNFAITENNKKTLSITRHGVTWTFSEPVVYGQFVNGDFWVLDEGTGVIITQISPLSTDVSGRIMHGSMINPTVPSNGYDNSMSGYSSANNVARPQGATLSATNPLIINGNASLVSTKTHETPGSRPQLVDASVLTVLTEPAPPGSFRPPYAGEDKSIKWHIDDIQWQLLPRLSKTQISPPNFEQLATKIERLWLDHGGGVWTGRYLHPQNNMPDYGRDMANITADISLALLLDFDNTTMTPLLVRFLQMGIDWYGVTDNSPNIFSTTTQGGLWMGGGGHGHGRKWPILFTGLMLNDSDILKYTDGASFPIFQEEQQYFYVTQSDVDRARYTADGRPREPYTTEMIGTPEWGEQHFLAPHRDGSNWNAYYRDIVSKSISGHALAALIMDAKERWNWDSFFDYQDRWAEYRLEANQSISYSTFVDEMWTTFRNYQ